jgi:peptidoglycan-N-acetylglucosamine deacetylase
VIEFGIVLGAALVLAGAALMIWRRVGGAATRTLYKILRVALTVCIASVLAFAVSWQVSKARTFQLWDHLVSRVETSDPILALTFDDGPTERTDEVLAILSREGVNATFFVTGLGLEHNPNQGKAIVAGGHELGNHTYSHSAMVFKSLSQIQMEIEKTDELIRSAGYAGQISFRPPYCKKLILLPWYLNRTNRQSILMDVEPESYADVASRADKITAHVLEKTRPGSIILLHVM